MHMLILFLLALSIPAKTQNSFTLYDSRINFNSDFPLPSQTCEDFENNTLLDNSLAAFPSILSDSNINQWFPAGIVPGLIIQDNPINDSDGLGVADGLVALSAPIEGTTSDFVVSNYFPDSTDIIFSQPVTETGLDVLTTINGPSPGATTTVTFFDINNLPITSIDLATNSSTGTFIGLSYESGISRVNLSSVNINGDEAEGADNICFSGVIQPPLVAVPMFSFLSTILLALSLLALGIVKRLQLPG